MIPGDRRSQLRATYVNRTDEGKLSRNFWRDTENRRGYLSDDNTGTEGGGAGRAVVTPNACLSSPDFLALSL